MRTKLLFVLSIVFIGTITAQNITYDKATITLDESLNTNIYLKPHQSLDNWGIGFFMLQVMQDPSRAGHARVCEESSTRCASMVAISSDPAKNVKEFIMPRLSYGHVPILSPQESFALTANKTYVISLSGFKSPPKNITAMPQNLFLYDFTNSLVYYIDVSSYNNQAYSRKIAQGLTNYRLLTNWAQSSFTPSDKVIVPDPQMIILSSGTYRVPAVFSIYGLNPALFNIKSLHIKAAFRANKASIIASKCLPDNILCKSIVSQPEGYVLDITPNKIFIYANQEAGWFYALETLGQLTNYYTLKIPSQTIIDYPRFKYRGLMLDVVRHFFNVSDVKNLLDIMAMHKLNTLHLHMADDEGWRLQLRAYPALTEIGASRSFSQAISASNLVDGKYDVTNYKHEKYAVLESNYGGYYTVSQMQDLIHYANARQITIIPEIELPGHAGALKKSLPEELFDPTDLSKYYTVQGYNDNILPICKYGTDQTFTSSINGIVRSVADVFAHQATIYAVNNEVSVAGDEVSPQAFTNYQLCQTGAYAGLSSGQLSHKFFELLSKSLSGYKLSGWQDLVEDNDGTVYSNSIPVQNSGHIWDWLPTNNKPVSGLIQASNLSTSGYQTVLALPDLLYFDIRYSESWDEPGLYWAANQTDTFSALSSGQVLSRITNTTNIVGLEGAMWSELVPNREHLFYMLLPKMSGLSEAAWSSESNINWPSLASRVGCGNDKRFLDYLANTYNVRYRGYPNGIKLEVPPGTVCY